MRFLSQFFALTGKTSTLFLLGSLDHLVLLENSKQEKTRNFLFSKVLSQHSTEFSNLLKINGSGSVITLKYFHRAYHLVEMSLEGIPAILMSFMKK